MEFTKMTPEELKQCIVTKKIITEEGTERKFDILDFYLFSAEKPKDFIQNIQDSCSKGELTQIKRFLTSSQDNRGALNNYLSPNNIIRIEYNYKGHYINETEKNGMLLFLQEHGIPVYEVTYFGLAKRYIDGLMDLSEYIEQPKSKIKIK